MTKNNGYNFGNIEMENIRVGSIAEFHGTAGGILRGRIKREPVLFIRRIVTEYGDAVFT